MTENMWPLPLRVKSDVFLGMKFNPSSNLQGRFQYNPTSVDQAVSASTYRPHHALTDGTTGSSSTTEDVNVFSSDVTQTADIISTTTDGYVLDNEDGIMANVVNLENVIQTILAKSVLEPSRASGLEQMMTSLNVVGKDHWSMMKIVDTKSPQPSSSKRKRYLRGSSEKKTLIEATHHRLGIAHVDNIHSRQLIMKEPHYIFYFQVYGSYSSRASSDIPSIIQTIQNFGKVIEGGVNSEKQQMIKSIRDRTGFDVECVPASEDDSSSGNETKLDEYNLIDLLSQDAPTTLACDDRLPLYFYDLNEIDSRGMSNFNANLKDDVKLSVALDTLKKESTAYDILAAEEETDEPFNWFWVYVSLG